jgi:Tfp pilus assembly protein PilF
MKRIYLFLCFFILITLLTLAPITIVASENSEKALIEQSLEYLEQQNYNEAIESLEKALLSIREKAQLELNNLRFTESEAIGFGMYQLPISTGPEGCF